MMKAMIIKQNYRMNNKNNKGATSVCGNKNNNNRNRNYKTSGNNHNDNNSNIDN